VCLGGWGVELFFKTRAPAKTSASLRPAPVASGAGRSKCPPAPDGICRATRDAGHAGMGGGWGKRGLGHFEDSGILHLQKQATTSPARNKRRATVSGPRRSPTVRGVAAFSRFGCGDRGSCVDSELLHTSQDSGHAVSAEAGAVRPWPSQGYRRDVGLRPTGSSAASRIIGSARKDPTLTDPKEEGG
jgi:hypothetical protein